MPPRPALVDLAEVITPRELDVRLVEALAGNRDLNARERDVLDRMKTERGDAIYSDMLYALTHRAFPSRQARELWGKITEHRTALYKTLGRDVGLSVAAHDYLSNLTSILKNVSVIEESKFSALANVASHDGMTGLYDQTTFRLRLKDELERQTRYGGALSLVMADIDHFKRLNDEHGHTEGDAVIRQIADIIRQQVRNTDTAARYGGEEFAIILPGVDAAAAHIFAERLRQAVEQHFVANPIACTVSLGLADIASNDPNREVETFIKAADTQLYRAKKSGRNRVCRV